MGGGHGPLVPKLGLGVDNLIGAQVVLADGSLVSVSEAGTTINGSLVPEYQDLLWALRGGGGSTFGVVISYKLRSHAIPEGGYSYMDLSFSGPLCNSADISNLQAVIDGYLTWTLKASTNFGGMMWVTPKFQPSTPACPGNFSAFQRLA